MARRLLIALAVAGAICSASIAAPFDSDVAGLQELPWIAFAGHYDPWNAGIPRRRRQGQ